MKRKFVLAVAAAAAVVAGVLVATASAANAGVTLPTGDCATDTVSFPTVEVSKGGPWAGADYDRTVVICKVGTAIDNVQQYHATVTDNGTFLTIKNANVPGPGTDTISSSINGTLTGGWTADFNAAADFADWTGHHGGNASFNSWDEWIAGYFGDKVEANGEGRGLFQKWSWTYKTCSESWTKAYDNNYGQSLSAGNITGKGCPTPSPTPSATSASPTPTATPTTPAPTPTTVTTTVTVTG